MTSGLSIYLLRCQAAYNSTHRHMTVNHCKLFFHKKLYHPSNALMCLYGDVDLDKVLALADSYLDKYTPSTSEHVGDAAKLTAPKVVTKPYPINAGDDPEGKAFYMRGWVIDHRCMK